MPQRSLEVYEAKKNQNHQKKTDYLEVAPRKYIKLIRGYKAIVDAADYDYLIQWNWTLRYARNGKILYAVRYKRVPKRKSILMHRFILNVKKSKEIDHRNGNGLDNRRFNLRICTRLQNSWNQKINKNNKSDYRGVHWKKSVNKWCSQITKKSKVFTLGSFDKKDDAAKAYNEAAKKHYGKFARLNKIPKEIL